MYKIFDIHTHTYPEAIAEKAVTSLNAFYEFVSEGKGTYAELAENSRANGVVGMLLFTMIPMITPLDSTYINVVLCVVGALIASIGLGAVSTVVLKKTSLV